MLQNHHRLDREQHSPHLDSPSISSGSDEGVPMTKRRQSSVGTKSTMSSKSTTQRRPSSSSSSKGSTAFLYSPATPQCRRSHMKKSASSYFAAASVLEGPGPAKRKSIGRAAPKERSLARQRSSSLPSRDQNQLDQSANILEAVRNESAASTSLRSSRVSGRQDEERLGKAHDRLQEIFTEQLKKQSSGRRLSIQKEVASSGARLTRVKRRPSERSGVSSPFPTTAKSPFDSSEFVVLSHNNQDKRSNDLNHLDDLSRKFVVANGNRSSNTNSTQEMNESSSSFQDYNSQIWFDSRCHSSDTVASSSSFTSAPAIMTKVKATPTSWKKKTISKKKLEESLLNFEPSVPFDFDDDDNASKFSVPQFDLDTTADSPKTKRSSKNNFFSLDSRKTATKDTLSKASSSHSKSHHRRGRSGAVKSLKADRSESLGVSNSSRGTKKKHSSSSASRHSKTEEKATSSGKRCSSTGRKSIKSTSGSSKASDTNPFLDSPFSKKNSGNPFLAASSISIKSDRSSRRISSLSPAVLKESKGLDAAQRHQLLKMYTRNSFSHKSGSSAGSSTCSSTCEESVSVRSEDQDSFFQ